MGVKKPGIESDLEPKPRYQAPHYKPADKLKDKVALITGGDSGIGRAVAVIYAREGADVAIVHLPEEQSDAEETKAAVEKAGRRALLLPGDISDPAFCTSAVEKTVKEFGKLDLLVNNAAYQNRQDSLEDVSDEQWDHTFKTNIYGYFRMAKAALSHLPRGGAIINTGSITGLEGNKQLLDYSSTKGAIHACTKSLAQNLVKKGHSRQLRRPRTGVDAAQSVRQQDIGGGVDIRPKHTDGKTGPTRGGRARLRLLRIGGRLELHHGGGADAAGW